MKRSRGDWLEADWGWLRAAEAVRDDQAIEHFTADLARAEIAFAFIARSRAWLAKNEFDKAQADVSEALRLEPNNARAYFARSRIAQAQERPDDELSACDRALEIDPRDPFALEARSRLRATAGEYDRAIGDLDRAIESLPRSSQLRSERGYCRASKGDEDQALADFNDAIQLDPLDAYSLAMRAGIHLRRQELDKALQDAELALKAEAKLPEALAIRGVVRAQRGEFDAALGDLDESIRLDATDPRTFLNRGRIHFLQGRYDAAVIDYTQAISLTPDDANSYRGRAEIWSKKGDAANAIIDLTQYLRLRPQDANAYAQRGWLRKEKDPDAAIADFDEALKINPRHVGALLGRGEVWKQKNNLVKALADLTAAIDADPNNSRAYLRRAELHNSTGEHRLVVDDLTAVLRIKPGDTDCLLWRSTEWSLSGNLEKAIEDCRAVLAKEPKNLRAYSQMAQVHSMAGESEKALEDFAAALRIDPHDEEIRFDRAYQLFLQDKFDLALADLDEVIRHGKRVADAYNWRGYLWMQRKTWDKALADFNEAIRLKPDHAEHWRMRANCWYGMKQFDKAIKDADEALRLDPRSETAAHARRQALEAKLDPSKADNSYGEATAYGDDGALGTTATEQLMGAYHIELRGPDGLKLAHETRTSEEFGPRFLSFPLRQLMFDGMTTRFKLLGVAGDANAALYAQLESKRLSPEVLAALRSATPAITLTKGDLDSALAGKDVTKILILRRHEGEQTAKPKFEVLTSTELDPKDDPITAASRQGAVAATLFISKRQVQRLPSLRNEGMIAICLRGPDGLVLIHEAPTLGRSGDSIRVPIPVPANFGLPAGIAMQFKLSGPPVAGKEPLYAVLKIPQAMPPKAALPAGTELSITFSNADLDAALAGKKLTSVLYLANPANEGDAPRLQTLNSTGMEPGKDPVAEASERGTVLATLKLSKEPFQTVDWQTAGREISDYEDDLFDLADDEPARLYEIELKGPEGVMVAYEAAGLDEFATDFRHLPIRLTMSRNTITRFKLAGIPGGAEAPLYVLLTSKTISPEVIAIVRAANPVLTLSEADLAAALAGKDVTKILVRRPREGELPKNPEFELLSSTDLDPNADPVVAASRRGAVIAGFLISKRVPALFSLALDDEQLALCLKGPEGLTLTYEGPAPSEFKEPTHTLPARFYQGAGAARRFKLGGPPATAKDPVYASLETAPTLPPDVFSATKTQLPITLSKADLEAALAGKKVTCVVYLTKTANDGEAPRLQILSSVEMESPEDAVAEASKHGIVLAVLQLSQQLADLLLDGFEPTPDFDSAEKEPPAAEAKRAD
ncbi:MAG TPA: tetratricopeptide repeat protein [Pirellulales bacterium]|nr:tetratricopeptide repeat protein [Pirellulales bacterium]